MYFFILMIYTYSEYGHYYKFLQFSSIKFSMQYNTLAYMITHWWLYDKHSPSHFDLDELLWHNGCNDCETGIVYIFEPESLYLLYNIIYLLHI